MKEDRHISIANNILTAHSRIAHEYAGGVNNGIAYYADSKNASLRWEGRLFDKILSSIFSEIQMPKTAVFLDAGCGNGQWIEFFAMKYGFSNFIATDFSASMLEYTKKRLSKLPVEVKYIRSNLESLDSIESDSVDIVHLFGVIEHLDNPEIVIREFRRILKNDGYLIINIPIKYSLCYFSYILFGISPEHWGLQPTWKRRLDFKSKIAHYRFYSKHNMRKMLSSHFKILQQHNTAFSYAISYLGLLHRKLPILSFALQDLYDFICRIISLNHPAGVYWLARKE